MMLMDRATSNTRVGITATTEYVSILNVHASTFIETLN